MALKLGPEKVTKIVTLKVGIPDDLLEQIEFYRAECGASKATYVIVEGTKAFLESDRDFQKRWEDHCAKKKEAAPPTPAEKRSPSPATV